MVSPNEILADKVKKLEEEIGPKMAYNLTSTVEAYLRLDGEPCYIDNEILQLPHKVQYAGPKTGSLWEWFKNFIVGPGNTPPYYRICPEWHSPQYEFLQAYMELNGWRLRFRNKDGEQWGIKHIVPEQKQYDRPLMISVYTIKAH